MKLSAVVASKTWRKSCLESPVGFDGREEEELKKTGAPLAGLTGPNDGEGNWRVKHRSTSPEIE